MNIAKNLQRLMDQSSISPERLAHDLSLPTETINAWLEGTQTPSMEQLNILKRCFSVTLDELCADTSANESPSERYVLPFEDKADIDCAAMFTKHCRRPTIAGLITASLLFAIFSLFQFPFYYPILCVVFIVIAVRKLIQYSKYFKSAKAFVKERPQGQWRVYTFTKDILYWEKWGKEGILEKKSFKRENISILLENDEYYFFWIDNDSFKIRKNLLTKDSIVHSFVSEEKEENRKHPPFLSILHMVLIMLTFSTIAFSTNVFHILLDFKPLLALFGAAFCILLPIFDFVVFLFARRKGEGMALNIALLVFSIVVNVYFMLHF